MVDFCPGRKEALAKKEAEYPVAEQHTVYFNKGGLLLSEIAGVRHTSKLTDALFERKPTVVVITKGGLELTQVFAIDHEEQANNVYNHIREKWLGYIEATSESLSSASSPEIGPLASELAKLTVDEMAEVFLQAENIREND